MSVEDRILRRPKTDPDRDALHTLRVGFAIFLCLLMTLPWMLP